MANGSQNQTATTFTVVGKAYRYSEKSVVMEIDGVKHFAAIKSVSAVLNGNKAFTGISCFVDDDDGNGTNLVPSGYLSLTKSGKGILIKANDVYFISSVKGFAGVINGGRKTTSISKVTGGN